MPTSTLDNLCSLISTRCLEYMELDELKLFRSILNRRVYSGGKNNPDDIESLEHLIRNCRARGMKE